MKNAPHSFSVQLERLKADGLIMAEAEGDEGADLLLGGGSGVFPRELHFSQLSMNVKLGSGQFGEVREIGGSLVTHRGISICSADHRSTFLERDVVLECGSRSFFFPVETFWMSYLWRV